MVKYAMQNYIATKALMYSTNTPQQNCYDVLITKG